MSLQQLFFGVGLGTLTITSYFRSKDPIYQCIGEHKAQSYQLSVPITAIEHGVQTIIPKGIGIEEHCIHPVDTLEENVIHVAYNK